MRLRPDRAKCRACRRSHVLLPAEYLPRRAYDVHVVGAALLEAAQALPEAVAALGGAARGYALALARPIRPPLRLVPAGCTGIDYLRLIAERHRLALQAGFGVIDPTGLLDDLRGWPLINVFARGGLLAPSPDG